MFVLFFEKVFHCVVMMAVGELQDRFFEMRKWRLTEGSRVIQLLTGRFQLELPICGGTATLQRNKLLLFKVGSFELG